MLVTPRRPMQTYRDAEDETHGEDLFPQHFIYTLNPSDSYFGADEVFADIDEAEDGVGRCKYVRFIDDCIPPTKKDKPVETLPERCNQNIYAGLIYPESALGRQAT